MPTFFVVLIDCRCLHSRLIREKVWMREVEWKKRNVISLCTFEMFDIWAITKAACLFIQLLLSFSMFGALNLTGRWEEISSIEMYLTLILWVYAVGSTWMIMLWGSLEWIHAAGNLQHVCCVVDLNRGLLEWIGVGFTFQKAERCCKSLSLSWWGWQRW